MSDMYAIKASTLTALGDAVRKLKDEKKIVSYSGEFVDFTSAATIYVPILENHKYRLTFTVNELQDPTYRSIDMFVGDVRVYSSVYFNQGETKQFDFVATQYVDNIKLQNFKPFTSSYVLEELDENDNVVVHTYAPLEMAEQINQINAVPESALIITGRATSRFANGYWDWFLERCGDQITTKDISHTQSMFSGSNIEKIPFDINLTSAELMGDCNSVFSNCWYLTEIPLIKGNLRTPTANYSGNPNLSSLFQSCYRVRYIPYDYFDNFGGEEFWTATQQYSGNRASMFNNCYSLRQLPNCIKLVNSVTSAYNHLYYGMCSGCYVLDEIIDIPVCNLVALTSNCFNNSFNYLYRLKELTFATDSGTPKTAEWKSQTIDLTTYHGYASNYNTITGYNSGITRDKEVTDDATYQALKNDPDWFTLKIEYSRYNHDSAVNTINSLPDTSAYLATAGGTNTIKFKGTAGSLTDGGAINTLTEEEIAVAAAKGWTVSLS